MNLPILYILLFVLFIGCAEKSNQILKDSVQHINLSNRDTHNEFDISQIYPSKIDLVSLKTENSFVIANIDKVELQNERIFVLDRERSNTLFVFDEQGNPVSAFSSVNDFTCNAQNLFLLSSNQNSIKIHDISTMAQVKTIDLMISDISEIASVGGNLLCYRETGTLEKEKGTENSTLFLINYAGKILKHWVALPDPSDYLNFFTTYPSLRRTGHYVYISRDFMDDFYNYSIEEMELTQSYNVRFEEHAIPDQMRHIKSQFEFYDRLESENFSYVAGGYCESGEYVFFNTTFTDKSIKTVIFDKKKGISGIYSSLKYADEPYPILALNSLTDDYCISVLPLELITSIKGQIDFTMAGEDKFMDFLRDFDVNNGNPVLLIMRK